MKQILFHIKVLFSFFETIIQKRQDFSIHYPQKNAFLFSEMMNKFKLLV